MDQEATQNPRERGFRIENWKPKVIDPASLPDIPAIQQRHHDEAMSRHASKRLLAAVGAGLLGAVIGFFAAGSIIAAGAGLAAGALLGFGIAHWIIVSGARAAAKREIMPDVARQCGGTWVEDAQQIVPPGNPLQNVQVQGFGSNVRYEYGDGISGRLPGHDLDYGIFNFTVKTERRTTDSEGNSRTETDTDRYIVTWLDLSMPVDSLEVKRRMLKGGGALGRLFDRVDSKLSDQNVLETESEQFNRAWKIEVADSADQVLVRRMFSPKVMDAFVADRVQLWDDIRYRHGRIWIVEDDMGHFDVDSVAQTLDHMLYRAQLVANVCRGLAREVGQDVAR
jgi:hypothetical protein